MIARLASLGVMRLCVWAGIAVAIPAVVLVTNKQIAAATGDVIPTQAGPARLEKLVGGLSHPWGIAVLPDGQLFITERGGKAVLYDKGNTKEISGLPKIVTGGQAGLLDVEAAPDFATSRQIFIAFSRPMPNGSATALASYRLNGTVLSDEQILFTANEIDSPIHFGARIRFDLGGHILLSIGERGQHLLGWPQQRDQLAGKIIRLNRDGSVPPDNPFVGQTDARPEVFSFGHRNPQGLAIQPGSGRIFETEHGPQGGDEVNIIKAGANYGWPVIGYGVNYGGAKLHDATAAPGMEQPLTYYVPSIGICGAEFHDGRGATPWQGSLFVAGLVEKSLRRLEIDGDRLIGQEIILKDRIGRIRDVAIGPKGGVYMITDEEDGALWRLKLAI